MLAITGAYRQLGLALNLKRILARCSCRSTRGPFKSTGVLLLLTWSLGPNGARGEASAFRDSGADVVHTKADVNQLSALRRVRLILLLGGYDKGRDPSPRRQEREIALARSRLTDWRARHLRLTL